MRNEIEERRTKKRCLDEVDLDADIKVSSFESTIMV